MKAAAFQLIDLMQGSHSEAAVIEPVESDVQRLSEAEHQQASRSFLLSDAIASGLAQDLAFVDEIPKLIEQIIDHKLWECLYVAKGVVTPYYCHYNQKSDGENFRDFIVAQRPSGLGASVATLDRVLQINIPVQRKFRGILEKAGIEFPSTPAQDIQNSTTPTNSSDISKAACRAAAAIPIVRELLERELITEAVAAELGQQLQNPERLTAEERDYVDRRDLVGLRLAQYVAAHPLPDDEDLEPVYRREVNQYVQDLLVVKARSRSVRINHPQKAAQKLLQFYQGEQLQQLVDCLQQGMSHPSSPADSPETTVTPPLTEEEAVEENPENEAIVTPNSNPTVDSGQEPESLNHSADTNGNHHYASPEPIYLTVVELAERLDCAASTLRSLWSKQRDKFEDWTQGRDPDGFAWQRTRKKRGQALLYAPVEEES